MCAAPHKSYAIVKMRSPGTVANRAGVLRKMRAVTKHAAQMWEACDVRRRGFHLAWGHAKHNPVLVSGLTGKVSVSRFFVELATEDEILQVLALALYNLTGKIVYWPLDLEAEKRVVSKYIIPETTLHECHCGFLKKTGFVVDRNFTALVCSRCNYVPSVFRLGEWPLPQGH
eukprot:2689998-Rhodomonas_salina.1